MGGIKQENTKLSIFLKAHIWKNEMCQPYYTDSYIENVKLR